MVKSSKHNKCISEVIGITKTMKIHEFRTTIKFRDDYNGRPFANILSNQVLMLVTHPFYCWEKKRYGRCYRHDFFCAQSHLKLDYEFYAYDTAQIPLPDEFFVQVMNHFESGNRGQPFLFNVLNHQIKLEPTQNSFIQSLKNMINAKLEEHVFGIFSHGGTVYELTGDFHSIFEDFDCCQTESVSSDGLDDIDSYIDSRKNVTEEYIFDNSIVQNNLVVGRIFAEPMTCEIFMLYKL
jgi:hypothetical protein